MSENWEKELDEKFPFYPNEPYYGSENVNTRNELKSFIRTLLHPKPVAPSLAVKGWSGIKINENPVYEEQYKPVAPSGEVRERLADILERTECREFLQKYLKKPKADNKEFRIELSKVFLKMADAILASLPEWSK